MIAKRSVLIRGHRTSYSLEQAFHDALARMAADRGVPLAVLVGEIDAGRGEGENLSSALRVAALNWALSRRTAERRD